MAVNNKQSKWREVKDILLDAETGDLSFENGDFVLGNATRQHQAHNLVAGKGDLRAFPQAGINLAMFLHSEAIDVHEIQAEIELQLELDGQTVENVSIDPVENGQVQIDAGFENS